MDISGICVVGQSSLGEASCKEMNSDVSTEGTLTGSLGDFKIFVIVFLLCTTIDSVSS